MRRASGHVFTITSVQLKHTHTHTVSDCFSIPPVNV